MPLPGNGEHGDVVIGIDDDDFVRYPNGHPDKYPGWTYDLDPLPNVNPNDRRTYPTPNTSDEREPPRKLNRSEICLNAMKQLGWFMFYVWVFVLLMIVGAIVMSFYDKTTMVVCACIGGIFGCMACCGTAIVYGEQDDYEERNYY